VAAMVCKVICGGVRGGTKITAMWNARCVDENGVERHGGDMADDLG